MKKPSAQKAINEMCFRCLHDPLAAGRPRAQVAACTAPSCPLFHLRPLPVGQHHEWWVPTERSDAQRENDGKLHSRLLGLPS